MREVVRGDKHNLRKSANRNTQISVIHSAHCTDLCFYNLQIFSGCVCHLEQLHAQSPFLFPIVFGINLIPFFRYFLSACCSFTPAVRVGAAWRGPPRGRNSCCLWLWCLLGFGVSLVVLRDATSNISPFPPTPSRHKCAPRWEKEDRRLHNPTLSANKHTVQICRSSLSAAANGLADCSGERRTSPFKGIERSLSRAVVPKTKSLRVSATTFPKACLCTSHRDACERISAIQAVLKAEPLPFEKEINIHLVCSSTTGESIRLSSSHNPTLSANKHVKHANEMLLGHPRKADQRTQSFHFAIVIHQLLDPAAQAPSSLPCVYMHSITRQPQKLQNASTRRAYARSR